MTNTSHSLLPESPSLLQINLKALAANYEVIAREATGAEVACVLKADAYGLGVKEVAKYLWTEKACKQFFVAYYAEALDVRSVLPKAKIYVLNGLYTADREEFTKDPFIVPVINSLHDLKLWQETAKEKGVRLPTVLHFDTGMSRLGLGTRETARLLEEKEMYLDGLDVQMIMSHFACADELDKDDTARQAKAFEEIKVYFPGVRASLCNSYGVFRSWDYHHDIIRSGMALYGLNPTPYAGNPMENVVTLKARLLNIQSVPKGESVGYGARYHTKAEELLATVSVGYADGFFRSLSVDGKLYWDGVACPIRGRVSMDLVTVSIDHLDKNKPQVGDMMEVIGDHQTADMLAQDIAGNSSPYEVLTSLGARYKRVYVS